MCICIKYIGEKNSMLIIINSAINFMQICDFEGYFDDPLFAKKRKKSCSPKGTTYAIVLCLRNVINI